MKKFTLYLFMVLGAISYAQQQTATYSVTPSPFEETQSITVTINGSSVNESAWGVSNNALYMWAWSLDLNYQNSQDCPTNGSWNNSTEDNKFTYNQANDTYTKTFVPATFFNRTGIGRFGFLVKAKDANGDKKSQDITVNVGSFQATLTAPANGSTTILNNGASLNITANNTNGNANYELKANGTVINTASGVTTYNYTHTNITANQEYVLSIRQGENVVVKSFTAMVNPGDNQATMPAGLRDGINYNIADHTKATLVLNAPGKDFVYVAGSFNGYNPSSAFAMKKDPASGKFWLELTGLTSGTNYSYQYWVVDQTPLADTKALVKTADPFSTLVLSPFDDPYITNDVYPNLPQYPSGQSFEVSVLQTGQQQYNWQVTNFQRPAKENLIIYETLIRDFNDTKTWTSLAANIDYFKNLHINAIELMPVMEFEGNISWGYNTAFHLAHDKAYGTADSMKAFIDLCHQNGIAVILDLALNHVYGRSPLARMWAIDPDGDGFGEPSSENPYCNTVATHAYSVGSDLNHQNAITQYYAERTIEHWMNEFNIDGFRWDLTKGFTQECTAGDESCTNGYHADRVEVLKKYADYQWEIDPDFYVIFEHLGVGGSADEEVEWANYRAAEGKGIMPWGNFNGAYNQLTMGYAENSNFNGMDFESRNFTSPLLVGFAESHDEERLMRKNFLYGAENGNYSVKNTATALERQKAIGAVLFTIPGPKMLWQFGELGYDFGINRCEDNTYDNGCRTNPKPVPSEIGYTTDAARTAIYDTWSQIINMRLSNPVFHTNTFTITSGTLTPRIDISNNNLGENQLKAVVVVANFDTSAQTVTTNFPLQGDWYNLMDNSIVNAGTQSITLQPGEFRILGNKPSALGTDTTPTTAAHLYPNPSTGALYINVPVIKAEIYAMTGQLVKSFGPNTNGNTYDVSSLGKGIYLVKVTDAVNRQSSIKLIKE